MRKKTIFRSLLLLIVAAVLFLFLQALVMPKYQTSLLEGALIREYYKEPKNHDIIFYGDCEIYETMIPAVLYKEYGINSFVRGSANQLFWQSYYLMEETLRYEVPDIMVVNVLAMKYETGTKEEYNRLTLDGMKLSTSKLNSIQASMLEGENFFSYLFPLLRYHDRIFELSLEDITGIFKKKTISHNGYMMQTGIVPVESIPPGKPLADYTLPDRCFSYLDKMVKLCEENKITLILMKAPILYPYWYEEWEEQIEAYAKEKGILYLNFLELVDEIGIDYQTDTYDAGLHLNVYGAEKVTSYFGEFLKEHFSFFDYRTDQEEAIHWQAKLERYEKEKNP